MAEILQQIEELTSLPQDTHWFCPRRKGPDDNSSYFDEDVLALLPTETAEEKEQRLNQIQESKDRKKQVLQACQILAFDGGDAQPYQQRLKEALKQQLTRCTICVREYHRGRGELKHDLEEQYDADQVGGFMERFDAMNIERITAGLDSALSTLKDTEPAERNIAALPLPDMFALFETMHCRPMLQSDELLRDHFDQPFRLVQTNKKISLPEYTPALTSFMFSYNTDRSHWALRGWKKSKRPVTASAFDWTIRDTLKQAMTRVSLTALEKDFMPIFWLGVRTVVEKLDQTLITHHLRALDTDVCKLALDHLQVDSPCYTDLLGTLQLLLTKSPTDFWDALGTISPQTVVEQIFNNPRLERLMKITEETEALPIEQTLSWIDPFLSSIKSANLPPACRALLHQLMTRYQGEEFSRYARSVCWRTGLRTLIQVLQTMLRSNTGGATIVDLLEMVRAHIFTILGDLERFKGAPSYKEEIALDLEVIQNALALDCHSLALDREAIVKNKTLGHDINISSLSIWKAAVRGVKAGDTALSSAIMAGVRKLLVLEPLAQKEVATAPTIAKGWNEGLKRTQTYTLELLERLQDFEPEDLHDLFASQESAQGLFALLFSGEPSIQQAAVTVLKVASSESSRRDGVKYIIGRFYTVSLTSMTSVFRMTARSKTFTPCLTFLKLGTDVLENLCNSQDGILRSKSLSKEEVTWTDHAWQALWNAVGVIFATTEAWSQAGHDKDVMTAFCKDAMQFADMAFDQYSVIAGALRDASSSPEDHKELDRRLLQAPREASGHAVRWLRLRDDYLITKAVSLTCKVMARLQEVELELPEESTFFIDDIIAGTTRSRVSPSQKAELRRALDNHLGQPPARSPEPDVQKVTKQASLSSWVTTGPGAAQVSMPSMPERKKHGLDMEAWQTAAAQRKDVKAEDKAALKSQLSTVSPTMEMLKARGDFKARSVVSAPTKTVDRISANDFRLKRQQEQELKKKRDAEIIAAARKGRAGIGEAGSGLSGLGVQGKDHSARGQGVMVSSDEESDDSDGLDAELFGLSTKPSKRKDTVKQDAANAVGLKREQRNVPLKLQRQVRSSKDMRARLAPDLAPLHKTILGWDYFHDGDYPPNSQEWQFKRVANSFRHSEDYKGTFQPLLTLEAWQGFVRSREENTSKPYEVKIVSRSSVDAFLELSTSVSAAEMKDLQIFDGDIVLFSKSPKPTTTADAPHCLARIHQIKRRKGQVEVVYRVVPGTSINSSLTPGSVIHGAKITSITPLEREYGALSGLQYYDLCDHIIKAQPSALLTYSDKQLEPLIGTYSVNKAQAKAIRSAVDNDAFTLIQGPPGSGKTKTIVAIVGALLSDSLSSAQVGTRIEVPKGSLSSTAQNATKKLLVCAPSNAAVDELVMRFKDGIKTTKGVHKKINVVRLGRSDAINSAVVDVTMDELVKQRLGPVNGDNNAREKTQGLMKEHQKVSEQVRLTRDKLDGGKVKGPEQSQLQDEFNQLKRRKNELGTQIDNAKDAENAAGRSMDIARKRVQQAVLDEAHVICATLSGSGHDMFQTLNIEFETVVVDEAAQCVEMSALIPLKYGCVKCILVGDPKQLPPTVFSKEAARFQYEQSLFVRMQTNYPDNVHLLDTQYRMHPDISSFPSATFYDGRLLDGDNMAGLRQQPWHKSSLLAPYRFFDVQGQHQSAPKGHSLINKAEVEVAISLYERLTRDFGEYDFKQKIGIITPYKSQLRELKERFAQRFGSAILELVEFNTTDAFQGRESEVIIFSCVRASPAGGVGFLQDIRRMNVGLTRAKSSLWVLGNSESLIRGEYWKKLVLDARARECYTTGNVMQMLAQPSSSFPVRAKQLAPQKAPTAGATNGAVKPAPAMSSSSAMPDLFRKAPASGTSSGRSTPISANDLAIVRVKTEPSHSPMEGVKVKLSDKVSNLRHGSADARSSPRDVDTEMKDADSASRSGASTPQHVSAAVKELKRPRSETPASGEEKYTPPSALNAAAPVSGAPPPMPRKRRPADPFMPKSKQQRRG